jgi:hypothetical protein
MVAIKLIYQFAIDASRCARGSRVTQTQSWRNSWDRCKGKMELDEDISPTSPLNRGIYLLDRQVVAASIGSCCGRQAMATGGEDLDGSAMRES